VLTVLITGQYRAPDLFARTLNELRLLRSRGILQRCVVSTWADDAPRFVAALADAQLEADILANRTPAFELSVQGHLLHQQRALRIGLDACPDGIVLRLRADSFISADLVGRVLASIRRPRPAPATPLFNDWLWVPWIDYEEPFHVADEIILGHREDLRRLTRCDLDRLAEYGALLANVHTLQFGPGDDQFPRIYFDFLAAQRDTGVFLNDQTDAKLPKLHIAASTPSYFSMLGLWHRAMLDHFQCFSEPGEVDFWPGGRPQGTYYTFRRPLPNQPHRLFDPMSLGAHNHFYVWDLDGFRAMIAGLDPATFAALHEAMASPDLLINDRTDHHAKVLLEMMRRIGETVPPGKEPDPGFQTRMRRIARSVLRSALRALG